jgi:CelD/BcsL family acetyltransferase involved in cellulose biosynthesis
MALYYFHLRDGEDVLLDPEGCHLSDLAAVADKAMRTARSLMSADVLEGRLPLDMRIDVVDEAGAVIHSLPFADAVEILPPLHSTPPAGRRIE